MTEPLVLLPAMCCDHRLFGPQVAVLGRHLTLHLVRLGGAETVEAMAEEALAAAPARFALLGQGLGGMVAMEMARQAPERVARLALVATDPLPEAPTAAAAREPRIAQARSGRLDLALREEFALADLPAGPQKTRIVERLNAMALPQGPETFVRHSRAMQRRPDQQRLLRGLRIPVLVLGGAEDRAMPPRRHELMATLVPRARLAVLPGVGRLPSLEQPARLTQEIAGWMGLGAGG
jgi:pimeloyl-ACP methyl ester carboxylesterase